jgi:hypothetical protein
MRHEPSGPSHLPYGYELLPAAENHRLQELGKWDPSTDLPRGASPDSEAPPPVERTDRQISLRQLLVLAVVSSIVLGFGARLDRGAFALLVGLATFATLLAGSIAGDPPPWMVVGWWILLAMYLLAAVAASIAM